MLPKVQDTKLSSVFRSSKKDKISWSLWKGWVITRWRLVPVALMEDILPEDVISGPDRVFHLVSLSKAEKKMKWFWSKVPWLSTLLCNLTTEMYFLGPGSLCLAIPVDSLQQRESKPFGWGTLHSCYCPFLLAARTVPLPIFASRHNPHYIIFRTWWLYDVI